jgi:hypothetical protein
MLLMELGPELPFAYSSGVYERAIRISGIWARKAAANRCGSFYAFDPLRAAVLLVGGDRSFYKRMFPIADALCDDHLGELKKGRIP